MATLFIDEKKKKGRIAPEIYGQFSEHLGRGIYQGIYVGKDSEIPNENGMRKDVVNALRELRVPVIRWPGGCFADEYHWKDTRSDSSTGKSEMGNWKSVCKNSGASAKCDFNRGGIK